MRRAGLLAQLFVVATAAASANHRPGEVLVRLTANRAAAGWAAQSLGGTVVRSFTTVPGLHEVRLQPGQSVEQALGNCRQDPAVVYAEPNYLVRADLLPADGRVPEQWALRKPRRGEGGIDAPAAWDVTVGSPRVVVAVIDTGVAYDHPDLATNMFRNEVECTPNGIDDDGDGYIDDCHGIDTYFDDGDPEPGPDLHGTHVAGIIGAAANNGGTVGINWHVSILSCKFLQDGTGSTADAIACLDYVARLKDRGVDIVATNNSWGGANYSSALGEAIEAQRQRGILFIAAAGNAGTDMPQYPAAYYLPNVLSVAATDRTDGLAAFSNFGRTTVHLGAPGVDILSTTPAPLYRALSGTSMATPQVTGVAALVKALHPDADWKAVKNLLLAGGDSVPALTETITHRRLNARGALTCRDVRVFSRLLPVQQQMVGAIGVPIEVAALNIRCAEPAGTVRVTVAPGGPTLELRDDGVGSDAEAGDGVYSGRWTPAGAGTFVVEFPDGDATTVVVSPNALVNPEPAQADMLGYTLGAIATDADRVLVGVAADDSGAPDAGAAHLFDGTSGTVLRTFTNPTPAPFDGFGSAVALRQASLLIGAPFEDGAADDGGAAYHFDAESGVLLHTLQPSALPNRALFGWAVAVSDTFLLVGAPGTDGNNTFVPGAAYLFDVASGALVQRLTVPPPYASSAGDAFGWAVGFLGTRLLVGAPGQNGGAVYVFDGDAASAGFGRLLARMRGHPPAGIGLRNGFALAPAGSDQVLVGDPLALTDVPTYAPGSAQAIVSGAAYLMDATSGAQLASFVAPVRRTGDLFGWSVASLGEHVVIGARQDPAAAAAGGAAYVFDRSSGDLVRRWVSPNPAAGDLFGSALASSETGLFASSPADDSGALSAGAVYRFAAPTPQDALKCYRARGTAPSTPPVTLADALGTTRRQVLQPVALCASAARDGVPLHQGAVQLSCYALHPAADEHPFAPRSVTVLNRYGVQRLRLRRASQLCVPSSKTIDRYQCYRAQVLGGPRPGVEEMQLADAFATRPGRPGRVVSFCTPVDQDGQGTRAPENALACYALRSSGRANAPIAGRTVAADVFGTRSLAVTEPATLCLPTQRLN